MLGEQQSKLILGHPMKASHVAAKLSGLTFAAALVVGLSISSSSYAGPGPAFWQRPAPAKAASVSSAKVEQACGGCADMKTTPVTVTKPALPNGRGPVETSIVGWQQTCRSCATSMTQTATWPNGRGPAQATTTAAIHVCRASVPAPASE